MQEASPQRRAQPKRQASLTAEERAAYPEVVVAVEVMAAGTRWQRMRWR